MSFSSLDRIYPCVCSVVKLLQSKWLHKISQEHPMEASSSTCLQSMLLWPFPQSVPIMLPKEASTISPGIEWLPLPFFKWSRVISCTVILLIFSNETCKEEFKTPCLLSYCVWFCRCMSVSLAAHNIRVNAIGPGSIMTEVLSQVANDKQAMNRSVLWINSLQPTWPLRSVEVYYKSKVKCSMVGCGDTSIHFFKGFCKLHEDNCCRVYARSLMLLCWSLLALNIAYKCLSSRADYGISLLLPFLPYFFQTAFKF